MGQKSLIHMVVLCLSFLIQSEFGNTGFFEERGDLVRTQKNLSEQGWEPTTNSAHVLIWDSGLSLRGGGRGFPLAT